MIYKWQPVGISCTERAVAVPSVRRFPSVIVRGGAGRQAPGLAATRHGTAPGERTDSEAAEPPAEPDRAAAPRPSAHAPIPEPCVC